MKVLVFKSTNEFIGNFNIDNLDTIAVEFENFSKSNQVRAYSYLECSGRTWTLIPSDKGLNLQEGRAKRSDITSTPSTNPEHRSIKGSKLAFILFIIAILEFIAAPIAGLWIGQENTFFGWMIFLSGLISGLILLGFSKSIDYLYECVQQLRILVSHSPK